MDKEALKGIKAMSQKEIVDKIKTREFVPPFDKKDRDEFFAFVGMTTEDREKYLAGDGTTNQTDAEKAGEPKPVTPEPKGDQGSAAPAPKSLHEELGYESPEKAKEAHKGLVELTTRLQSTIDRLNSSEGKRGEELKRLREDYSKAKAELEAFKPSSPESLVKPVRPKRPSSKDKKYTDGAFDEKYIADLDSYENDLIKYEDNLEKYRDAVLQQKVTAAEPKESSTDGNDARWDELWNKDIPEFQTRMNLNTTVPVKRMSEAFNAANSATATADEKLNAKALIDTFTKADHENYAKVRVAVESAYTFDTGVPLTHYRKIETALIDKDMVGEGKQFNSLTPIRLTAAEEAAAREAARKQKESSAAPAPGSSAAGGDSAPSSMTTTEQKKDRYRTLLKMVNDYSSKGLLAWDRFKKTPDYQEYLSLRQEIVGRVPVDAR